MVRHVWIHCFSLDFMIINEASLGFRRLVGQKKQFWRRCFGLWKTVVSIFLESQRPESDESASETSDSAAVTFTQMQPVPPPAEPPARTERKKQNILCSVVLSKAFLLSSVLLGCLSVCVLHCGRLLGQSELSSKSSMWPLIKTAT